MEIEDKESLPLPLASEGNGEREQSPDTHPDKIPPSPRAPGHSHRENGANPRAKGSNPRATGKNPRATGTNPRANGTNPHAQNEQENSEGGMEREPGIEFQELRQLWDSEMRPEGTLAGFKEYLSLKKARDGTGMSLWPGLGVILDDITRRKKAGYWDPGYEMGLGRYLAERTWLAAIVSRASPTPAQVTSGKSEGDIAAQKTLENYQRLRAQGVVE